MLSRMTDFPSPRSLRSRAELDRTFDVFDELRRQMARVWGDLDDSQAQGPRPASEAAEIPRINLYDTGPNLVLEADVPGVSEKDLEVTLEDGVVTLSASRKLEAPAGYTAHRAERTPFEWKRIVELPVKVDAEKTTAEIKAGVLTVTIAKAAAVTPRRIAVRAA